jgi:TIR domain
MSDVAASAAPNHGGTVFISYARADDEKPPFDDTAQGWVAFFWQQLRFELTNAGVNQAKLWLDRYDIDPAEDFTEKIDAALREARLIIPILSPNWVSRSWCQRELERFLELKSKDCIVLVKKRELPEQDIPAPLRNRQGYNFFRKEPGKGVHEFYWRGLKEEAAYFDEVRRMADWISERMRANAQPVKSARATSGRSIYVAAPADELRDPWQRLVNDLKGAGYVVLPAEAWLPDTALQADEAVRAALGRCEVSVHLLGTTEGMKPEGSDEGIVRRQLRLAREHAGGFPSFLRILWAPKWLPEHPKRDPFEVVNRFGTVLKGEEVYAEEVTDLSQWLRGRLDERTKPEMLDPEQLLLVAGGSADDDDLVNILANRLQSDEIKVKPLFAGNPMPPADAASAAAALVPWGKADQASIDALLSSLSACAPRLIVLRLPGGDEIAKRRFFREGIYCEPLDAVPPDRKAARELLVRIEIVQPDERSHK